MIEINGVTKTRIEHYQGSLPEFASHLRTFGEAGTVKISKDGKVKDRGVTCMFVGYASDHTGNVYRMFNPLTKRVSVTRDVFWLHRMYYERVNTATTLRHPIVVLEVTQGVVVEDPPSPREESPASAESEHPEQEAREGDIAEGNNDATTQNATAEPAQGGETTAQAEWQVATRTTRSGRVVKPRNVLNPTHNGPTYGRDVPLGNGTEVTGAIGEVNAVQNYYASLQELDNDEIKQKVEIQSTHLEIGGVGAGVGGGFGNTAELRPMKLDEALNGPDGEKWLKEVDNEHDRMVKNGVWEPVNIEDVPEDATLMDSTWACKKKSDGTLRGRLNARGFKQKADEHFDPSSISSPVTNCDTIRIVLTLMLMAGWTARVVDVKGAFLHGKFDSGEKIYMKVPQGMEKHYPSNVVLFLRKTIYGLKQAARAFWNQLLECLQDMDFARSRADPCLYYAWTAVGLCIIISWIDDNLIVGSAEAVAQAKEALMDRFDCEDCGELDEYIGCKIDRIDDGALKMTQHVLQQSYSDEFELPEATVDTPARTGNILTKGDPNLTVGAKLHSYFRSGVGKLLHHTRYTRPEISNAVRDAARHMQAPNDSHIKAMHRIMQYCRDTPDRGLVLRPDAKWDGSKDFKFRISGRSDSDYAGCPETRRSVTGTRVSLNGAPVSWRSSTQKHTTLSVTEAEMAAGVTCAQDMLYTKNVLESIGLQVELPMVLEMDNRGAIDLANNWSVGGRTRHVDVRNNFMRELKEAGILVVKWVSGEDNDADMHTKNLGNPKFDRFASVYTGETVGIPEREGVAR